VSPGRKPRVRVGKCHKPRSGGRVPTAAGFLQESVCLAQRLYRNRCRRYAARLNLRFYPGLACIPTRAKSTPADAKAACWGPRQRRRVSETRQPAPGSLQRRRCAAHSCVFSDTELWDAQARTPHPSFLPLLGWGSYETTTKPNPSKTGLSGAPSWSLPGSPALSRSGLYCILQDVRFSCRSGRSW